MCKDTQNKNLKILSRRRYFTVLKMSNLYAFYIMIKSIQHNRGSIKKSDKSDLHRKDLDKAYFEMM